MTEHGNGKVGSAELSWRIGEVTVSRVEENIIGLPTKVLVPDITPGQIEAQRPWIDPYFMDRAAGGAALDRGGDGEARHGDGEVDGEVDGDGPVLRLSLHSFVIESGETTIVVDTCVGPDPERALQGDPGFGDRLASAIDGGLEAVDVVVCTHLHFDHVGWNTVAVDGRLVPTFGNARYLITRAEIEEMERDDHMAVNEPSVRPLAEAGVLDVIDVDGDGHRITDHVTLISTPGHTPGHVSVLIESAGARALITGDAFHSPLQFAYPELAAWRFDSDSEQSTRTRLSLIDRFVDTDTLVLGTHFAPPTGGRLRHCNSGDPGGPVGPGDGSVWFDDGTTGSRT